MIKKCPFCGEKPEDDGIGWGGEKLVLCINGTCENQGRAFTVRKWNERKGEEAKQREAFEAGIHRGLTYEPDENEKPNDYVARLFKKFMEGQDER